MTCALLSTLRAVSLPKVLSEIKCYLALPLINSFLLNKITASISSGIDRIEKVCYFEKESKHIVNGVNMETPEALILFQAKNVPRKTRDSVQQLAKAYGYTMSQLLEAMVDYVDKNRPELPLVRKANWPVEDVA